MSLNMAGLNRSWSAPAVAYFAMVLSAGCGGAGLPVHAQTDAVAAIRSARELGAESTPQASYHLALADEGMVTADAAIRSGQMDTARRLLERAKADAELAMALRREAEVRARAEETHEHIEEQRETTLRPSGK